MWSKRSELLAPLSTLTSDKNKWKWTSVEQEAFDKIKQVLSRETLLAFPNFDLPLLSILMLVKHNWELLFLKTTLPLLSTAEN